MMASADLRKRFSIGVIAPMLNQPNTNRISECDVLPTSQSLMSQDCQEVLQPRTIDIINVIVLPNQEITL